jgi:hypothetical protein
MSRSVLARNWSSTPSAPAAAFACFDWTSAFGLAASTANTAPLGHDLVVAAQTVCRQQVIELGEACDVTSRPVEFLDDPLLDRILPICAEVLGRFERQQPLKGAPEGKTRDSMRCRNSDMVASIVPHARHMTYSSSVGTSG